MKTLNRNLGLVALISTLALPSFGRDTSHTHTKRTSTTSSETETYDAPGGGRMHFGFGLSTYGGGTIGGALAPALSGWLDLSGPHSLQLLAAINSTSPFQFGTGAVYRFTVLGDRQGGFHLGLGVNLGTLAAGLGAGGGTSFFMNIFPVVGFHFTLGGSLSNIMLAFDGGPNFAVTPSPFQFTLLPHSGSILGASIHYFF